MGHKPEDLLWKIGSTYRVLKIKGTYGQETREYGPWVESTHGFFV